MFQNRKECYWVTYYQNHQTTQQNRHQNHTKQQNRHQKKKHHHTIRRAHVLVRALVTTNEMVQRTASPLLSLARQEEDGRADF
jgi:predicted component of type VI protein secretion system